MAENLPIVIIPTSFPAGYCPPNWQTLANDLANGMSASVPGAYTVINYSTSEPAANDRSKPWYRLNPDGTPDKWYVFADGGWIAPHPEEAGGDARRIFTGFEADVWAYDGGDGVDPSTTAPTDSTGAMWEVDHNFDFRFPLGAGTSPAPASTTVNSGDIGGEEDHVLLKDELPAASLKMFTDEEVAGNTPIGDNFVARAGTSPGGDFEYRMQPRSGTNEPAVGNTEVMGDGDGHNTMPPYLGVFFIRRTARRFFVP